MFIIASSELTEPAGAAIHMPSIAFNTTAHQLNDTQTTFTFIYLKCIRIS